MKDNKTNIIFRVTPEQISANDFVCNENNLKVIDKDKRKDNKGKCYYEWQQDNQGRSWKSQYSQKVTRN